MNKDQKAALVEELAEQIRSAEAIFAVDYRGISVSQAAELRSRLRDAETRFRIVKNSLTERASDKAGVDSLKAMLEGPTALAFVTGDAALAAKALSDASRTLGTLEFKGGLMDGATLTADDVRSIARLPSREVLHAQLVGTIAAPLSGLVRTLNALIAGIAVQLQQIAEKKAEEAPASEAEGALPADTQSESDGTRTGSDADAPPPEAEAPEAEAAEAPAAEAAEAPEAEAAETPAEVAEEPAAPEETEQTETEAAADESSEAK